MSIQQGRRRGRRVCLITTGHPSTNPRLVKEAEALSEAGYGVSVVACKFLEWADKADEQFARRPWTIAWCRFGDRASVMRREWLRSRRRLNRMLVSTLGYKPAFVLRAFHYVIPELARLACKQAADLYIAHNLGALPAAARAAELHAARLGFDAEDFHRGELAETPENEEVLKLTRWIEEGYMPRCDYVTAASDGIAEAYHQALSVPCPTTILNVFPLAERSTPVAPEALRRETRPGTRSLYWFSQTIGPNRGLEDALATLPLLDDDVHLFLRGQWASGYQAAFMRRAADLGVSHRVHGLSPVPPAELIPRAARHDVGLALEQPATPNRDLCVTNKIFTYLLAGVPCAATATAGQRRLCADLPEATRLCDPGDPVSLARAVRSLLGNTSARHAANRYGTQRYNWEVEKEKFLRQVSKALRTD